jgi:hypothetical protein
VKAEKRGEVAVRLNLHKRFPWVSSSPLQKRYYFSFASFYLIADVGSHGPFRSVADKTVTFSKLEFDS